MIGEEYTNYDQFGDSSRILASCWKFWLKHKFIGNDKRSLKRTKETSQLEIGAGFIMTGAFAHGAIFFIRDYNPEQNKVFFFYRFSFLSFIGLYFLWMGSHCCFIYI